MVEAHERVGDDEAALGQAAAVVRQRHRRLELGDEVVAEVADDRLAAPLGLLVGEQPRAAADERVAPEPALLDRLEQESSRALAAQPEVGPERGEEIGVEHGCDRGFGQQKRPSPGLRSSGDGLLRPRSDAGSRPARAPGPPGDAGRGGGFILLLAASGVPGIRYGTGVMAWIRTERPREPKRTSGARPFRRVGVERLR